MTRKLRLGEEHRGIQLGNWRWKISDTFDVEREPQPFGHFVDLKNGSKVFRLTSDGQNVYIEIYGTCSSFIHS